MARKDPRSPRGRNTPAGAPGTSGAPRDAGGPLGRTQRGTRPPTPPVDDTTISDPSEPVTITGPRVPTGVTLTPPGRVRLRIDGSNEPTELERDLVAVLFAVGLQTPEPDRFGWVRIGELDFGDQVGFLVGSTGIDRDTAMYAWCRGVERALGEGVAGLREHSRTAPDRQAPQ